MTEIKDPLDHILPHLISIGSSLGHELKVPEGSGTLIKFVTLINGTPNQVYGIITASHVLELIELAYNKNIKGQFIGLLKLSDRLGNAYSETYPIKFHSLQMDKGHYRRLVQNHEVGSSYVNERDIAFICLGIGKVLIESELIKNSEFYDLDTNPIIDLPREHKCPFVFFKGTCKEDEAQDRSLKTELVIEQGGIIKQYRKSKIIYHEIQNTTRRNMKGASGTGLWIFQRNANGEDIKILKGVVVEGDKTMTTAIDISYITGTFLTCLKEDINQLYERGLLKDENAV